VTKEKKRIPSPNSTQGSRKARVLGTEDVTGLGDVQTQALSKRKKRSSRGKEEQSLFLDKARTD